MILSILQKEQHFDATLGISGHRPLGIFDAGRLTNAARRFEDFRPTTPRHQFRGTSHAISKLWQDPIFNGMNFFECLQPGWVIGNGRGVGFSPTSLGRTRSIQMRQGRQMNDSGPLVLGFGFKTMQTKAARIRRSLLFWWLTAGLLAAASPTGQLTSGSWNPRAAADYLDGRFEWWTTWSGAARDHNTYCVSCHTVLAYSLARPSLRSAMGEIAPSANERRCLENVTKRVRLWKEVKPYYTGKDASPSRNTEAVLNALILATRDARSGDLSDDAHIALSNMWASQLSSGITKGAWEWIQFDNEPWEAHDSLYYGAALAALAAGAAPGRYRAAPEVQDRTEWLRAYLNREFPRQSPLNQAVVLWASVDWPDLITADRRAALTNELLRKQQADGGWSLASLLWTWRDWSFASLVKLARSEATPLSPRSDGYATGLVTLALERSGVSLEESHIRRARAWLVANQTDGHWPAYSPNGKRNHSRGDGLFMTDAATAYAVLALMAK